MLTPEENLWMALIVEDDAFRELTPNEIRAELLQRGFRSELVEAVVKRKPMIDDITSIRLPVLLGIMMAEPPPPLFYLYDPKGTCDVKTKECKPSFTFFVTNGVDFFGYETFHPEPELEPFEVIQVENPEEAAFIFRAFQGEFSGAPVHDEPEERSE